MEDYIKEMKMGKMKRWLYLLEQLIQRPLQIKEG
jgi:hypothetical protein